ncbi:hypothetical protein [Kitasatospora sp. NA04385]|nr:hypothetical protein [Kitasatospora sp. NA04385]
MVRSDWCDGVEFLGPEELRWCRTGTVRSDEEFLFNINVGKSPR